MIKIVTWTRVPGLLSLGAAAVLAGCEAPTAVVTDDAARVELPAYMAKKTGQTPANPPACPDLWEDGPDKLCLAPANTKHGNDSGLPVNLNGVENGDQYNGNGNGAALTVTVLGTLQFDLSKIYMNTVVAGDVETVPSKTPVDTKGNGDYQASIVDVNGDGILDLVLHFNIPLMVANGDLSRSTTEICVYGEGPGYVLNGCGQGDGGGDPPPPPPPPDPVYPSCANGEKARGGFRCAEVIPFRVSLDKWWIHSTSYDVVDRPGWETEDLAVFQAEYDVWVASHTYAPDTRETWVEDVLPAGFVIPDTAQIRQFEECGYPEWVRSNQAYTWAPYTSRFARTDVRLPRGSINARVELIVDDNARVFLNGVELTRGFESTPRTGSCLTYDNVISLRVPNDVLSADGLNRLAVHAYDEEGYINYLDVRFIVDVPAN